MFFLLVWEMEACDLIAQTKLVLVLVVVYLPQGSWEEDRGKSKTYF